MNRLLKKAMDIYSRLLCILILFFTPLPGKSGGYASWQQKTIYGSAICNGKGPNGYKIGIKCKEHLGIYGHKPFVNNITKWYFHKRHIIGVIMENDEARFFIFDEVNCQIQIIHTQDDFDAVLREKNLKPLIWTRWYERNWGLIITDGNMADKLDFMFIIAPFLFIFGMVALIGLVKTKFSLKHRFNQVTLMITGAIIVRIILDLFPDSI